MNRTKKQSNLIIAINVAALLLFSLVVIVNLNSLNAWLAKLLTLLRPVLIGLVLAYLCNPFFRFYERKLFAKLSPIPLRRTLALVATYLTLFAIFAALLLLILPQLFSSVFSFLNSYENYLISTVEDVNEIISWINVKFPLEESTHPRVPLLDAEDLLSSFENFFISLNLDLDVIVKYLSPEMVSSLFTLVENIAAIVTDTIFGLFISLYLLASKEKRAAQIMRMRTALFNDDVNLRISRICSTADRSFGSFLKGKLLDSSIVGVLVYFALSLLNVPYAILIATIVAITDIVPIIGPFVGVIPSAVIILLTDPSKVIPFLLCILVIQQIDGNIIAPKILGENTGVSSLCVMIAITIMGSLMGLVGMVIGVPLFATVGELFSSYLDGRLKKKGLPSDTQFYQDGASMELEQPKKNLFRTLIDKILRFRANRHDGGRRDLTDHEKRQLEIYAAMQKHKLEEDDAADDNGEAPTANEADPLTESAKVTQK